jgi:hypothetical protein
MLSEQVSVGTTVLCDFLRHLKITRKKDSLRCRASSRRCHRETRGMEETPRNYRHYQIRFHRRNLGENKHDSALWLGADRQTSR